MYSSGQYSARGSGAHPWSVEHALCHHMARLRRDCGVATLRLESRRSPRKAVLAARAAVTKDHNWAAERTELYCLMVLDAGTPKIKV